MEEVECCVCLQGFAEDGEHIPRVLGCGHTLCQECLVQLARGQQQQQFVRCPECTRITSFPSPSSLPKNIELLRVCGKSNRPRPGAALVSTSSSEPGGGPGQFVLRDLLLHALPTSTCIRITSSQDLGLRGRLVDGHDVSLFCLLESGKREKMSVVAKDVHRQGIAAKLWHQGLPQTSRKEIISLLSIASRCHTACKVLGMWLSDEQDTLFLVNNIPLRSTSLATFFQGFQRGTCYPRLIDAASQLCDILVEIHSHGMVLGMLDMEMFVVNQFGRIFFHWNGALEHRRAMHRSFLACDETSQSSAWHFTSPEMLTALSAAVAEQEQCPLTVGVFSDVWSLACLLLHLLVSRPCPRMAFTDACQSVNKMSALLRGDCTQGDALQELLLSCLAEHPNQRPSMKQLVHHLQLLRFPEAPESEVDDNTFSTQVSCCFGLQGLPGEKANEQDGEQDGETVALDVLQLREAATLEGHTACITGLAVCGTVLVSVSFDKTVRLWSLEDNSIANSPLWSWEGEHSQRIQALVIDETSRVCYTGDYGGLICAWKASEPFQKHPLAKWQDHNDWRFTGVSALAISDDEILYSGSGDMLVKAWNTETQSLLGTFQGHHSLVSTLALNGELLYSGSWDGHVRMWCRRDFSLLGVFETGIHPIRALAISPDDEGIMCGLDNGCMQVWKDGRRESVIELHDGPLSCLATVSRGGYLCTGGWDKALMVVRVRDGVKDDDHVRRIEFEDAVMSIVYEGSKLYVAAGTRIKVFT